VALQESVTLQERALQHFGFDGILNGKGSEKKVKKETSFSHGTSMGIMEVLGLESIIAAVLSSSMVLVSVLLEGEWWVD